MSEKSTTANKVTTKQKKQCQVMLILTNQTKNNTATVPGVFLDKGTPDIDITDKVIVQCNIPIVKIIFADNGKKQITNKFWCECSITNSFCCFLWMRFKYLKATESLQDERLLFTNLIHLERIKGWVGIESTQ